MCAGMMETAEVDQTGLITHAEAAVLRDAAFGDIELAHDLDALCEMMVVCQSFAMGGMA